MAQIGSCWQQDSWVSTGGWASGTWANAISNARVIAGDLARLLPTFTMANLRPSFTLTNRAPRFPFDRVTTDDA